jgi:hypothetical protein
MHIPGLMLQTRRTELYQEMEVSENRHSKYERGKMAVEEFSAIKHKKDTA